MRLWLVVSTLAVALAACKRNEHPPGPEHAGSGIADISLSTIEALGNSCDPASRAELVTIAASTAPNDIRCAAMKELAALGFGPQRRNLVFTRRTIAALDHPNVVDALRRLLAERQPACRVERGWSSGEESVYASPAQVALWTLMESPLPSLRADVEALPTDSEERKEALRQYDVLGQRHDSPAVLYVEGLAASGSPEGFEKLIEFIANGFPWPNSLPQPDAADSKAVHGEIVGALQWLVLMTGQHPEDARYAATCVRDIKQAIQTGRLGELLLTNFDRLDADFRFAVMNALRNTARPGSRGRLQQIAAADPDKRVRDAADSALELLDRGGFSALHRYAGSGAP